MHCGFLRRLFFFETIFDCLYVNTYCRKTNLTELMLEIKTNSFLNSLRQTQTQPQQCIYCCYSSCPPAWNGHHQTGPIVHHYIKLCEIHLLTGINCTMRKLLAFCDIYVITSSIPMSLTLLCYCPLFREKWSQKWSSSLHIWPQSITPKFY